MNDKLDRIDLKILTVLQTEARITNVALAERVGLSASPCLERVKRLEKAKLVKSYGAALNIEKLIRHVYAYMEVTLESHHAEDFARFERYVTGQAEILSCSLLSGDFDYLLRVIAADVTHLHEVSERMFNAKVGVHKHFTYIVVKTVKDSNFIPLDRLQAAKRETALG